MIWSLFLLNRMINGAVGLFEVLCARSIWFLLKFIISASSASSDINWIQFFSLWFEILAISIIHDDLYTALVWLVCVFVRFFCDSCCSIRLLIWLFSSQFFMNNFLYSCIILLIFKFCSSNFCEIKSWLFFPYHLKCFWWCQIPYLFSNFLTFKICSYVSCLCV